MPAKVTALADLLGANRDLQASVVLRRAFPQIAEFFLPDDIATPEFLPIYSNLLLLLGADDRFGGGDWEVAETLALAVIGSGPPPTEYTDTLACLTEIWKARANVGQLDWALDLLDRLLTTRILDRKAMEGFFAVVSASILDFARRLGTSQRALFALICQDLDRCDVYEALPAPHSVAEDGGAEVPHVDLAGKLVAIYSLTESAAQRAKSLIEKLFPGVKVKLSQDHVGSPVLRSLAREADYFLVASKSAKHAATEFIKAERPSGKLDIIHPSGKGSSSLLTALQQAIRPG